MKEFNNSVYPNLESLSEVFNTKPYGFKEKIKWNDGEYLVFVREDKLGDTGTEIVFRKLITE
jgi:hypothetical protein